MKKNQYQGQINLGYIHEEEVDNQDDLNIRDKWGLTEVMRAASEWHADVVKYLHQAGADLNVRDNKGWTAVRHAALGGNKDIVRYLHAIGAAK